MGWFSKKIKSEPKIFHEKRWTVQELTNMDSDTYMFTMDCLSNRWWNLLGLGPLKSWEFFQDPISRDLVLRYEK